MLSFWHLAGMALAFALVTGVGVLSARRVSSASDFTVGGRTIGAPLIVGTIVGTLVGGASTVGTAQLAFRYGFSAWWFTLGGGIACLILGLILARPLRESGMTTAPGYLASVYGDRAGLLASLFSSLGIFLNMIAQVLAAVALLTAMFDIPPLPAALGTVGLLVGYVIFGGVWGTGLVGIVKTGLLYLSMIAAGVTAWRLGGGVEGFRAAFPAHPWFSLFGRGVGTDLAAAMSLLVGVLSTQTYLQAMFSGKNAAVSRRGAIVAGLIIPPVGLAGILAGLYMRAHFPETEAGQALPAFVLRFLPDWLGGIVLATLVISVIGTGAGLVLGMSTMLGQDIYRKLRPSASEKEMLRFSRAAIVALSLLTLAFVGGNLNSLILKWSFLSMGLRGSAICLPLLWAVHGMGRKTRAAGTWAIGLAPVAVILWAIWGPRGIDPLVPGLGIGFGVLLAGTVAAWLARRRAPVPPSASKDGTSGG